MAKLSKTIIAAAAAACTGILAGCSSAPDKALETSSFAHKKTRTAEVMDASGKPTLAQTCAQRHLDYQAGRNQPTTLEQKKAMDAACAGAQ